MIVRVLFLSIALTLVGCGGGSSGSGGDAESGTGSGVGGDTGTGGDTGSGVETGEGSDTGSDGGSGEGGDTGEGSDTGIVGGSELDDDPGPGPSTNGIRVVFGAGLAAPGVPGGTLRNATQAVLGRNGELAFGGSYESDGDTLQGLWSGLVDSPVLLLSTADSIAGLPANIRFKATTGAMSIATDGSLGALVDLQGGSEGRAFVVSDGSNTRSVLYTGVPAPGFTDGVVGTLETLSYSNAGAVLGGQVSLLGGLNIPALWHWNGTDVRLLATFFSAPPGAPPPLRDQSDCGLAITFVTGRGGFPAINDGGVVAFPALRIDTEENDNCSGNVLVRIEDDRIESVVADRDSVPGTASARFNGVSLGGLLDSGSLAVNAVISDDNATGGEFGRISSWIFPVSAPPSLVALVGESIPPAFDQRLDLLSHVPYVVTVTDAQSVLVGNASGDTVVLSGAGHPGQPYPDIGAAGATALDLVAASPGTAPAGFPDTAFISSFGAPAIDRTGRVYYRANIADATDDDRSQALFVALPDGAPQVVVESGDTVSVGIDERAIRSFSGGDVNLLNALLLHGSSLAVSDVGTFVVSAVLEDGGVAILHVSVPR